MYNKKLPYKGIVRNKTEILLLIKESKRKKGSRYQFNYADFQNKILWEKINSHMNSQQLKNHFLIQNKL